MTGKDKFIAPATRRGVLKSGAILPPARLPG